MKKQLFSSIFMMATALLPTMAQDFVMWYDRPAQVWTEALPLGNGRLGAMVYGTPAVEHLQLNEETLWAGRPNNNANPEALQYLEEIRQLVFNGEYRKAQDMCTAHVKSATNQGMPYQTFGDLYLTMPGHNDYSDYYRELSLDSAKTVVTYKVDGVTYRRETFSSFTDNVIIMRLTADKPASISFSAQMTSPHADVRIESVGDEITLGGISSTHEKLKGKVEFHGRVTAKTQGGRLTSRDGVLTVQAADEAIVYVSLATCFVNYKDISADEEARTKEYLDQAMNVPYDKALNSHVDFYKQYADRCVLNLGENKYKDKTMEERLLAFRETHDAHLVATYFRFGRYLLISSSQPGGQPANLQGIWCDKLFPSWDSKYTVNINAEMNYWPSEVTNLTELNDPLFRLIREVSETGEESAKIMYGAKDGWVLHHNTDIWRVTGSIDNSPSGMWMSGGAWLTQHLWQHYLYTGDKEFLREVYPIMRGAASFFNETMVIEPTRGYLVVCPSNSPENAPTGNDATTAAGCAMDNQLIHDLWTNVIAASEILNLDHEFAALLKERRTMLVPHQVGCWGQLQEWMHDWDNPKDQHRHISHLYALFPGAQITARRTPELFDAARTSLLARGDISTGWAMGWRVCFWARLLDGNHAYKLIENQLQMTRQGQEKRMGGGTYPNLFDSHPPFQIDGNFGCTAGIAEMLMQSHDGDVWLLPALPDYWQEGEIKGLVARGGFVIDMKWSKGRVTKLTITSRIGGNLRLRSANRLSAQGLKTAKGENPNPLFTISQMVVDPIISPEAKLNPVTMPKTYLYDLKTEAGKSYVIVGK